MGNAFFQFKQFIIHQSEASLKVCTESCVFGACIPAEQSEKILDIGTGTGLLTLMLAQRSNATISAVEIDEASTREAKKNFELSPWNRRLKLYHGDIKKVKLTDKFDLIVSNPPFFINQLKSSDKRTNTALHGSDLQPQDLCEIVNSHASEKARFFVLLPEQELSLLRQKMEATGWIFFYEMNIYQQAGKKIFRQIGGFCKNEDLAFSQQNLIIYEEQRSYSTEFIELLKNYYLYL